VATSESVYALEDIEAGLAAPNYHTPNHILDLSQHAHASEEHGTH
jgi:hypothetical protein